MDQDQNMTSNKEMEILPVNQEEPIAIRVKTMDSSEILVKVFSSDSILKLKENISQKINIDPSRQRLIFQGKMLKDQDLVNKYKILEDMCINLVAKKPEPARPSNPFDNVAGAASRVGIEAGALGANAAASAIPGNTGANQQVRPPNGQGNLDLVQEIMRTFNETNILRRNRRLIFQQNARHYLQQVRFNQTESFDILRRTHQDIQCLMESKIEYKEALKKDNHMPNIDSRGRFRERQNIQPSENSENYQNIKQYDLQKRNYEIGMWIDAKDTIEQWLEAQIININENQIQIHYNGWGVRWDEWLDKISIRLAVFRTHTVQNPKSNYLSPIPNIMPDPNQRIPQQQYVNHNLTSTISNIHKTVLAAANLLNDFNVQRSMKDKESQLEEEKTSQNFENKIEIGEERQASAEEEKKEEANTRGSQRTRQNNMYMIKADSDEEIIHKAAQLAPIIDRVGRMLSDLTPQLNNIVRQHQLKVQEEVRNSPRVNPNVSIRTESIQNQEEGLATQEVIQPSIPTRATRTDTTQDHQSNDPSVLINQIQNQLSQAQQTQMDLGQIESIQQTLTNIIQNGSNTEVSENRPFRIINQVPIMHSPGEISQVANMFDSRIFDDNAQNNDPNIEFHIHAFLSPNIQAQPPAPVVAQASAGDSGEQVPDYSVPRPSQDQVMRQEPAQRHQEVGVGPEPLSSRPQLRPNVRPLNLDSSPLSAPTVPIAPVQKEVKEASTQTQSTSPRKQLNIHEQISDNQRIPQENDGDQIDSSSGFQGNGPIDQQPLKETVMRKRPMEGASTKSVYSKPNMFNTSKGFNFSQSLMNNPESSTPVRKQTQVATGSSFSKTLKPNFAQTLKRRETNLQEEQIRSSQKMTMQKQEINPESINLSTQSQWRKTQSRIFGTKKTQEEQEINENSEINLPEDLEVTNPNKKDTNTEK